MECVMDIKQIMEIIPHRQPFLLVDRIVDMVPGESVTAIKNVSMNEPFFAGHFPNEPVMPGVLIVEPVPGPEHWLQASLTWNGRSRLWQ